MKTYQGNFRIQQGITRLPKLLISTTALIILSPFLLLIGLTILLDKPGGSSFHIVGSVKTVDHSFFTSFAQ